MSFVFPASASASRSVSGRWRFMSTPTRPSSGKGFCGARKSGAMAGLQLSTRARGRRALGQSRQGAKKTTTANGGKNCGSAADSAESSPFEAMFQSMRLRLQPPRHSLGLISVTTGKAEPFRTVRRQAAIRNCFKTSFVSNSIPRKASPQLSCQLIRSSQLRRSQLKSS